MIDLFLDALLDTLKLSPYLFITFLIIEIAEKKITNKHKTTILSNRKVAPIAGALLGAIPQCGFSAMAANLYSARIISTGTLIAIFLSTSDEMFPIMLGEQVASTTILQIICTKIIIGIFIGIIVDLFYKKPSNQNAARDICEHDHCGCKNSNTIKSCLIHTLKTSAFILISNLLISSILAFVTEEKLSMLLQNHNPLTYLIAAIVGLIPNCASSIIIAKLYLKNLISLGTLLSGLLPGCGLGTLLLFKNNKNKSENISIILIIIITGIIGGILIDFIL